MTSSDYTSINDPLFYPSSTVLKNKGGYKTQKALEVFERNIVRLKSEEGLPTGLLETAHYRAIHKHLFGEVYDWAGEYRVIRIGKGGSMFCYPEYIEAQMNALFSGLQEMLFNLPLSRADFAKNLADFLSQLNAIHPFREGNGRTQLAFLSVLCTSAQRPLLLDGFEPEVFLSAMITSFKGDSQPLENCIYMQLST